MSAENDARNEDWLRTTRWDLPTDVDRLAGLIPLEKLVTLPAWEAAPPAVRTEVLDRLRSRA